MKKSEIGQFPLKIKWFFFKTPLVFSAPDCQNLFSDFLWQTLNELKGV